MAVSTFLYWLISQCFFYVHSTQWNDGQFSKSPDNDNPPFSQLGFEWLPTLVAAIIGAVMLLVLIGLSFKKYKSAMPVVGSCSAAISAACHPPEDEDLDQAALGLLMWGETLGRAGLGNGEFRG